MNTSPIFPPRTLESQYLIGMRKVNRKLIELIKERIYPKIYPLITKDEEFEEESESILEEALLLALILLVAENMIKETYGYTIRQIEKRFLQLGYDPSIFLNQINLETYLKLQTSENVRLIKSVVQDKVKEVQRAITNGVSDGKSRTDIEKKILKILQGEARMKTIARTETSKIQNQLTDKIMIEAGAKKGFWNSRMDGKQRRCHGARHGVEYEIAKGCYSGCDGRTIKAGREINCRCIAIYQLLDKDLNPLLLSNKKTKILNFVRSK